PMARLIPVAYKVGGRHISGPTGPDRDSSLRINKAPGKCCSCREAQTANAYIVAPARPRQRQNRKLTEHRGTHLEAFTSVHPPCFGRTWPLGSGNDILRNDIACALKERLPTSPTRT